MATLEREGAFQVCCVPLLAGSAARQFPYLDGEDRDGCSMESLGYTFRGPSHIERLDANTYMASLVLCPLTNRVVTALLATACEQERTSWS